MKLGTIKINNFRNYEKENINFNDGVNIIYGNNGVGKTNLVEAIYVLSLTKSFRNNNDKNLIKNGEVSTKIEGVVERNNNKNTYQVIINKDGKKVKIDNNIQAKISDYVTNINVILLCPDEQTIFSSSPSMRRKLINIELSQLKKEYLILLNDYNKILKQRNFYIREMFINGNSSRDYLNILTDKLVDYGLKIHDLRNEFIDNINEYINNYYNSIFESGTLNIKYASDYNNKTKEEILNMYDKNYSRELQIGKTLYGIHHDDLIFMLDKKDISEYGSNGQQKNAILSFKLAELEVFRKEKGDYPILILDDMFSALDRYKIKNIMKIINKDIQIFITTTELNRINKKLLNNAKLIKVTNGKIEVE
jgi:DNA replication and repair protein RecF